MCLKRTYILCCCSLLVFASGAINKRSLVYPGPIASVQAIMGAGFPLDLEYESALIGIVVKSHNFLPRNATDYTNPAEIIYARRRRRKRSTTDTSRWDFYDILAGFAEMYGLGVGKECVLRAICETAQASLDHRRAGLFDELFHIAFTPATTNDIIQRQTDNEYYAAQKIGNALTTNCAAHFRACTTSLVDMFTTFHR